MSQKTENILKMIAKMKIKGHTDKYFIKIK